MLTYPRRVLRARLAVVPAHPPRRALRAKVVFRNSLFPLLSSVRRCECYSTIAVLVPSAQVPSTLPLTVEACR